MQTEMSLLRKLCAYSRTHGYVWAYSRTHRYVQTHSASTGAHHFTSSQSQLVSQIMSHTELTRKHLTPEIQLHLITPNCKLWHIKGDNSPFSDPFWAFYWPGGQAVTRYILDNEDVVKDKHILDVGCGCGASSIASHQCGAAQVLANDIDTVATVAVQLNGCSNGCNIATTSSNHLGAPCHQWDVIILGDMFYDSEFAGDISDWLNRHVRNDTLVLIGDPGRLTFVNHPMKSQLTKLVEYELPANCRLENNGLTSAAVWKYILDNEDVVKDKHILDVGCGCGASSIASHQCGAAQVLANDIDTVATVAVQLNGCSNGCNIATTSSNHLGAPCHQWDVIILGDMFYDSEFAGDISDWLNRHVRNDTLVLIGDPGRLTFVNHPMKSQLTKLVEYELPANCRLENNGLTSAAVWKYSKVPTPPNKQE